ncbi:MAG: hypothetical protein ACOVRN_01315 [Flavobacterium sp.]
MNYSYGNTLTIKSSPSEFEFHGKPNEPNVTFANGKQYISKKLYIHKPSITGHNGEMCIEHTPATNYDEPLLIYFPLQTDKSSKPNMIDRMLLANPGESLEVNLNTILPQNGDFEYKGTNIAIFKTPIIINTRILKDDEPIVEGAGCVAGSQEEAIVKLQGQVKVLMDAVEKHTKTEYPTHHSGSGGGGGDEFSEENLKNILQGNGIKCTPLRDGNEKKSLRLIDIDPSNAKSKIDISNPIAYTLAGIILSGFFYFGITSVYKRALQSVLYAFNNDAKPTLERMHIYEGIPGFLLLLLFVIFVAPSGFNSRDAAGIFVCAWILYSITLGMSRKSIIIDVMNDTYELNDLIRTVMRSITYNMFIFYPLFPLFAAGYAYKLYKK